MTPLRKTVASAAMLDGAAVAGPTATSNRTRVAARASATLTIISKGLMEAGSTNGSPLYWKTDWDKQKSGVCVCVCVCARGADRGKKAIAKKLLLLQSVTVCRRDNSCFFCGWSRKARTAA
jgi:hypothetical protein